MKNTLSRLLVASLLFFATLAADAQSDDLASAKQALKKRDYAGALALVQPLSDQGDAAAMAMLGRMRLYGWGVVKDENAAIELLQKSAAAGDAEGMALLARQMQTGNGLPKDEAAAAALFLKAAEMGNPEAQAMYAISMFRGQGGVAENKAAAVEWFRKSAAQGNPLAQSWLGLAYENGEGVEKSPYEALGWYRKAALQFEPTAQRNLGLAYARGVGVARDDVQAKKWLLSAAYLGERGAMEDVGVLYETGRTGVQDLTSAYMWYSLALARAPSRTVIKTALDRVAARLNPAALADAQNRAKLWPVQADFNRAVAATDAGMVAAAQTAAPATAPSPGGATSPARAAPGRMGSGSGFVVGTGTHYVVTNHHVVKDCKNLRVMPDDLAAMVRAKDERNDLALLSVNGLSGSALKLRTGRGVRPGEDLVTLGYPLAGLLAAGASVSTGTLTNLGGINNDTSRFQISVPTQPGNSGGPVLDSWGQVVGVVVAQIAPLMGTSDNKVIVAQNVNFAVNTATLTSFLEASNVDFAMSQSQADPKAKRMGAADVGALGRRATVRVECTLN